MDAFGDELRRERERRGLSLAALSEQTKVNLRHFEALERGDFHQLPGGVFRRGIFRSYVSCLGLEEGEWLARFEATAAEHARRRGEESISGEEAWFQFASNVKRNRGLKQRPSTVRWLGVGGLMVLLGAAFYALWIYELRGLIAR